MYQLIQGAHFLPHLLDDKTTLPINQITLDTDIIQDIYQKEIANVRITKNLIHKGNGIPIYYNTKNVSEELLQRGLGSTLVVNNGEIQLHQTEIQIQVIDHQFQFIKDQNFINRQQQGEGFLSFDNRYRFILNPKTNFVGYWIIGNKSLPTTKDIENAIYTYIQSSQNKIKFTKQASFIVVYFGLNPTYFFVTAGPIQQTVVHKQALKLWENFLNKNSFSSDLHCSYNEVDQLEHQINQLSKEFDLIRKILQGDADLQQQSWIVKIKQLKVIYRKISSRYKKSQRLSFSWAIVRQFILLGCSISLCYLALIIQLISYLIKVMNKFQAIILAGGVNSGSFLYPLCANYPKALLPVCNRPMIAYSLDLIDHIGITDIIVIATENNAQVSNAFGRFKNKIDFVIVNDDTESGSAILQIADKIKKDFIILSCDTITDVNLLDVIDYHASQQSILTMVCKEEDLESKLGKAPVSCNLDDTYDIMLLSNNRLVHIVNADENPEEIIVKKHILMKFDEVQVMPNLFDSHIYVCKQQLISIMQQLAKQTSLSSFKDDVIPLLAKNQCNLELLKLFQYKQDFFQRKQTEFNINVFFTNNYMRRLNNLKDYKQANFDSLVKGDKAIKAFYHSHQIENIQPQGIQAKISPDSVFGEDCHIGEKVTIQRSIIGKHCKIGNNVKISNSIIFREGVIHSGSIIQNCILANNTYVEQNCILDKCETGAQTQIEQGTKKVEESIV